MIWTIDYELFETAIAFIVLVGKAGVFYCQPTVSTDFILYSNNLPKISIYWTLSEKQKSSHMLQNSGT